MSRIPFRGWVAIGVGGLLLLAIILYFFTIDEIELGFPPKVKLKRRRKLDQIGPPDASRPLQSAPAASPESKINEQPVSEPAQANTFQPNLVHPYPLQANFTGRVKERHELTKWLSDDEHPIYELVAMGGMGKSALTWVWLTQDVLKSKDVELDGVMWWSFYEGESSFAKLVDDALKYVGDEPIDAEQFPTTYDRAQELRRLLQNKRVLFVLDGFERQLRAFAALDAVYKSADETQPSTEARSCVDPITSRLLRDIAAVTTRAKVLLTSRLAVSDLQDRAGSALAGVIERDLKEMSRDDAISFMRAQGVTKGTDAEVANACENYGYHALSLRLLSGLIAHDAKIPGDIAAAPRHEVYDDLIQRQHHVLEQSYNALSKRNRALLSRIAAFRGPASFADVSIFNTLTDEKRFEQALTDLRLRGHLQRDSSTGRYDLHPLVRRYAYDRLADKTKTHARLVDHFKTLPQISASEIRSVEDLSTTIELFHHLIRAERFDEALTLFQNQLNQLLFYRFGAHKIRIDLLQSFFTDRQQEESHLTDDRRRGWVLNGLANSYLLSGQPHDAIRAFEIGIRIVKGMEESKSLSIGLANIAKCYQELGEIRKAEITIVESISVSDNNGNDYEASYGRYVKAGLFTILGQFDVSEAELENVTNALETRKAKQQIGTVYAAHAANYLLKNDHRKARSAAEMALDLGGTTKNTHDIIRAKTLLGNVLIAVGEMTNAERALTDALIQCRRINLQDAESDILLALARWHLNNGNPGHSRTFADEALTIADRSAYRLKQADIHNFLAQLAFDADDRKTARTEAETAKERAWCDGPPYCYKPAMDEAERMLQELGDA